MSLIEKIDAEIEKLWLEDDGRGSNTVPIIVLGLEQAKQIILAEKKEPLTKCTTCGIMSQGYYCPNCGTKLFIMAECQDVNVIPFRNGNEYDEHYRCGVTGKACEVKSCPKINPVKTKGDKIRESNENLADYIKKYTIADKQRILDYFNQPQEGE